ncbi:MAG: glycosyltransferase [Candidatus Pacebacteria bacterium]|nr:glycosyltransferase [Candidatus Paceibacterota bacterium]
MKRPYLRLKRYTKEKLGLKQLFFVTNIYRFIKKIFYPLTRLIPRKLDSLRDLDDTKKIEGSEQNIETVSVILSGYQRPHTLKEQYAAVMNQTYRPSEVLFWQNGSVKKASFDEEIISKMKAAKSNYNFGVWARFAFALNCKSKYICIFDDDTIPGKKWLENCIQSYKKKPGLYGTIGLIYKSKESYYGAQRIGWDGINNDDIREVDIVGHAWFFEREMLSTYWKELPDLDDFYVGEDMHFSYMLQKYTDLRTYVPPHPINNKELWGSLKGEKYGGDAVATGSFAVSIMDNYFKKIVRLGFKIINDKR